MIHINSLSKRIITLSLLWFFTSGVSAQIVQKIGDNYTSINDNAVFEIESTTKGFLLPRMTKAQRDAIDTPPEGLMLWCTDCSLSNGSEIEVWIEDSWTGLLNSNLAENNMLLGNANGKAEVAPFNDAIKHGSVDASEFISTSSTSDVVIPGMSKSPESGSYLVTFNSQYNIIPAREEAFVTTSDAINDLALIRDDINMLTVDSGQAAAYDIGGKTITPGVYSYGGALSATTSVTLDAENDPNALFVFKTGGAFNTTAGIKIKLVNGASANNIFWVAAGAIGIGADCTLYGTLLSELAVAVGARCIVEGRMLTTAGAIAFGPGTITVPSGPSAINLRAVSNFVALTTIGAIANTGVSTFNGDIATGAGAITAFDTAIVNGKILLPDGDVTIIKEIDGNATFSLYQNGELIPNSSRIRTTKVNTVDVTLQAIATVAQDESIEVRWSIDKGTLSVNNRILTIIKVN
ncbi:ice-binding family protein [Maribacter arcticus]|uniref:ice-binding family protein n=1 Tax=Maribacter arcticus TaxID=561365 RepID=UPI0030032A15